MVFAELGREKQAGSMLDAFWKCLFTGLVVGLLSTLVRHLWDLVQWNMRRDLPPGPRGMPLFGYLPFMPKDGHRGIERLRQKYGNVFGLQLGGRYVVFLCDFASVKEALSQDALLSRPEEFPINVDEGAESMIVQSGPPWKEQRRFTVKAFKDLVNATQSLERETHEELSHLLSELESLKGAPVHPASVLTPSTSNVILALVFGRRLAYDDPRRATLDELVALVPASVAQVSALNFVPWLRKLLVFFRVGAYGRLRDALARRDRFSDTMIDFHMETYKEGVVRDFIDAFLKEMKRPEQEKTTFTRNVLRSNVSSFLGAGSESVRTALEWLLLTCAAKPELQSRIHGEIDAALEKKNGEGGDSRVSWKDRGLMPYTQAFMWETTRYKPINPVGVMRCASEDVKIGGYVIPRGSVVVTCLWSVFHDASFWGDPEVFRPERFLSDDGTRASKPERLIPFSSGKRSCPGEGIANMETFIFFATILRHFAVELPPDVPALVFDEKLGISLRPKPQKLVFRRREIFGRQDLFSHQKTDRLITESTAAYQQC
ncbi:cytochrome P450 2J4-like [Amblyomma americanum]